MINIGKEPFSIEGSGMSQNEFDKAVDGLIAKGLAEELIGDPLGRKFYRLTDLGVVIGSHMTSDPSTRN